MNFKIELNQQIADFITQNGLGPGVANWRQIVRDNFEVSDGVLDGIWRTLSGRRRVERTYGSPNDRKETTFSLRIQDLAENNSTYPQSVSEDFETGAKEISTVSDSEIRNEADLIRVCKIDTTKWSIKAYRQTASRISATNPGTKFNVSVTLVPKSQGKLDIDTLTESFRLIVSERNAPVFKRKQHRADNLKTLVAYLSDIHIGAHVPVRSLYANEYNEQVVFDRMNIFIEKLLDLRDERGVFDTLILNGLGDLLDGWNNQTTRGGHPLCQNMDNREQFNVFLRVHKYLFDTIMDEGMAEKVKYIATTDANHDADFSYIANIALATYLEAKYPEVELMIAEKFISHYFINKNTVVLFCHGKDGSDMKFGLPLTMNPKTEVYINDYLNYNKLTSIPNIHFIKGDLHQSATTFAKNFRYRSVRSFFGGSKWIHTNHGTSTSGIDMDIFSENDVEEIRLTF